MNESGRDGLNPSKKLHHLTAVRDLSQQLNALELEDDDDNDESYDPMNISDFLNSKGELTGLSEWTDSEHEEVIQKKPGTIPSNYSNLGKQSESTTTTIPGPICKDKSCNSSSCITKASLDKSKAGCQKSASVVVGSTYSSGTIHDRGLQIGNVVTRFSTPGSRIMPRPSAYSEQVFTRAPNFRTPGGYKPPLFEKEPRNMTDEDILLEVKQMYAEDRLAAQDEDAEKEKDSLQFLLNNSHFPERDGESRRTSLVEVEEAEVIKSASWVCGNMHSDADAVANDLTVEEAKKFVLSKRQTSTSRTENLAQLSRLWNEIQHTKHKLEQDITSLAKPGSPVATSSPKQRHNPENKQQLSGTSTSTFRAQAQAIQDNLPFDPTNAQSLVPRRNFSFGKRAFMTSAQPKFGESVGGGGGGDSGNARTAEKIVRPRRTVRSKGKVQRDRREQGKRDTDLFQALIPRNSRTDNDFDLDPVAIDEILDETDLHDSDLDEILSEISEHIPEVETSTVSNFFQHANPPGFPQLANTSGIETYKHKYYEERYRRDHCENEISKLQKQLLETTEKMAVFDGLLRGKEVTISKLTKVNDRLQAQLKSQAKSHNEKVDDLQSQNTQLIESVKETMEKVSSYKQELDKIVELNSDLKVKLQGAIEALENERTAGGEEKEILTHKVDSLQSALANTQVEKESSLRALRDCQGSLDTTKKILSATADELELIKSDNQIKEEKFDALELVIEKLKSQNQNLEIEKSETGSKIKALEAVTLKLKSEKALVDSDARRKVTEERETLHEYYNNQIKEILGRESAKMIAAEKEFVTQHEVKLERIETETKERLEKMRFKFTNQFQQMKSKFDAQVLLLKKENEEKSKLIGTVSEQLRNFSQRDRGGSGENDMDRNQFEGVVSSLGQNSRHVSLGSLFENGF